MDNRQQILDRLASCIGPEAFKRLVDSQGLTRSKGRLRFWQEELFRRFKEEAGHDIASLEQFLRLFEGTESDDEWERLWQARMVALERVLGPSEDNIVQSLVPFYLDGAASVLIFRNHIDGVVYVTADLVGDERSKPNSLGQCELMICLQKDADWAPSLLGNLAKFTTEEVLSPRDTMDIGRALPKPTQLSAFLFVPYAELTVEGNGAGILLCIGITSDEMMYLRENGYDDLLGKLKDAGVYPYTNLSRGSILQER